MFNNIFSFLFIGAFLSSCFSGRSVNYDNNYEKHNSPINNNYNTSVQRSSVSNNFQYLNDEKIENRPLYFNSQEKVNSYSDSVTENYINTNNVDKNVFLPNIDAAEASADYFDYSINDLKIERVNRYKKYVLNDENNLKKIGVFDHNFYNGIYNNNRIKNSFELYPDSINREDIGGHGTVVTKIIENFNKQSPIETFDIGASRADLGIISSGEAYSKAYNNGVRVFSNSYGGRDSVTSRCFTCDYFGADRSNKDSIFVFSTGNNSELLKREANYPRFNDDARNGWIAVAAYHTDTFGIDDTSKLAYYSNYFGDVAKFWGITANGNTLFYRKPDGRYYYTYGTSFSAPRVSAVASNVWNKFPWMTNHLVVVTILSTANQPGTQISTTEPDDKFGWGILNEERALKGPALFHKSLLTNKDDKEENLFSVDFEYRAYKDKERLTWSNDIKGDAGIKKRGTGLLYLSGYNEYKGKTLIENGEIVVERTLSNSPVVIEKQGTLTSYNPNYDVFIGNNDDYLLNNNGGSLNVYGNGLYLKGSYKAVNGGRIVIDIDKSLFHSTGNIDFGENGYLLADIKNINEILKKNEIKDRLIIKSDKEIINFNEKKSKISEKIAPYIKIHKFYFDDKNKIKVKYARSSFTEIFKDIDYKNDFIVVNVLQNLDKAFDEISIKDNKDSDVYQASLNLLASSKEVLFDNVQSLSGEIYASYQNILLKENDYFSNYLNNKFYYLLQNNKNSFWFNQVLSNFDLPNKTKLKSQGINFGLFNKIDNFYLNLAFYFGKSNANFNKNIGNIDYKKSSFDIYSAYNFNNFYLAFRGGVSNVEADVGRKIIDNQSNIFLNSNIYNLYSEIGKNFNINKINLNLFLSSEFQQIQRGDIKESQIYGIQSKNKKYNLNSYSFGIRSKFDINDFVFNSSLIYAHKNTNNFDFLAKFNGIDSDILVKGLKQNKNNLWFNGSIKYNLNDKISVNSDLILNFDESKNKIFYLGASYKI